MNEQDLQDMVNNFREQNPETDYTFGHIVIADDNITAQDIHSCYKLENVKMWLLQEINDATSGYLLLDRLQEYVKVHEFLQKLRIIAGKRER